MFLKSSVDFDSFVAEYPFVNKTKEYPVGHAKVIRGPIFSPIKDYFGLVKCTIVPPRKLLIPVIPSTTNGKLYFTLCRTCASRNQKQTCTHTDDERAISGTYCTPELVKAEELGYVVSTLQPVPSVSAQIDVFDLISYR